MSVASGSIILTGFMGTGKTSVGHEVARRLNRPFVDMDVEIETRAGKSISAIFADEGEPAFRQMEAQLCRELARTQGKVIATGGGALVDPDNRRRLLSAGPVFCLTCATDEISRRLAQARDRPLLDAGDRQDEIARLLAQRYEAYAAIPRQIDTTSLTTDEVAERVIEQAFSTLLPVHHPGGSYPIHVAEGLLDRLGSLVRSVSKGDRIAVVSNATVAPHYQAPVLASLRAAGWSPFVCTIPDGERHKTLDTAASLYAQFVQEGLDRSGIVLALGGGVVCDVTGFVAATYMRGVPVVQVPTTLLAMVDASVGGKTGVDLPQGKNLVGAFKQPELVAIDPAMLDTLPPKEIASGMAELVKHAVIADRELFDEMQASIIDQSWAQRIARSLQVKIDVVEQDPYERGWRAVLNLGHTVGHALEQVSSYRLRHGEGVSIGMVAAARISEAMGLSEPSVAQRLAALLSAHDLPVTCPAYDPEEVWAAVGRDKKKRGEALRWVLPRQIGQVEIVENVPREVVLDTLARMTTSERSEQG